MFETNTLTSNSEGNSETTTVIRVYYNPVRPSPAQPPGKLGYCQKTPHVLLLGAGDTEGASVHLTGEAMVLLLLLSGPSSIVTGVIYISEYYLPELPPPLVVYCRPLPREWLRKRFYEAVVLMCAELHLTCYLFLIRLETTVFFYLWVGFFCAPV